MLIYKTIQGSLLLPLASFLFFVLCQESPLQILIVGFGSCW